MFSALFSVSTRPAFFTAVTRVDSAGLFDAAVATGSLAMPSKEPAPSFGTEEQAGPNGSSMLPAMPEEPAEASSEAGAEADAFAELDASLSLLSLEQAVRAIGRTAAVAKATAT